jgi:SAM-dependent methyltransferase
VTAAGDVLARALVSGAQVLARADGDDPAVPVDVARWAGPLTAADEAVVDLARCPVLDIGCGPGRHVRAAAARGMLALGVELHPGVAAFAAQRGAPVLTGSIFDRIPGAGTWRTALLLDGSVGIGGDVEGLLRRVRELLHPDGAVLVELDPPGSGIRRRRVRLLGAGMVSSAFWWASVAADALAAPAAGAGLRVHDSWVMEERWFGRLGVA